MPRIVRFYRDMSDGTNGVSISRQGSVIEFAMLKGKGEPSGTVFSMPAKPSVMRAMAGVLNAVASELDGRDEENLEPDDVVRPDLMEKP